MGKESQSVMLVDLRSFLLKAYSKGGMSGR